MIGYAIGFIRCAIVGLLLSRPAHAGQIDYILKFADVATAKQDAVAVAAAFNGDLSDFLQDHAMQVKVTRISTGNPIAGFFVLISMPRPVAALLNHAALQLAIDRDKMNARQPGAVLRSTVGGAILQDIIVSPVYAGSNYPWGGLN